MGMAWLRHMDAWIACKEGAVYGKLKNGKSPSIKDKRALSNVISLVNETVHGGKTWNVFGECE